MSKPVKKIVIVGGGSAGWLTAGILAAEHLAHTPDGVQVTLIESANIPTIGVGEGTWPTMRDTLNSIGIDESEFITCCDASFKQGSQFVNWRRDDSPESYYHPFMAPHGFGQSNQVNFWHQYGVDRPFAHALSAQPHLCDAGKAPKQFQTPSYAMVANYGYHLDAGKFTQLLTRHCTTKLGVEHILDDVTQVIGDKSGSISAIDTKAHGQLEADLFIDCSGSKALLIGEHYQIPLKAQKSILFNDSAIAVQVPYENPNTPIASHTISTAHNNGWIWDIGLPTRRGIGCVYAQDMCTAEQAQHVLIDYLSKRVKSTQLDTLDFRALKYTPGYRETLWHHNCVAVGMSAGFIEPLEASALALVELSAKMIAKELPANTAIMAITAKRFNQRFNYRWERIIEFLKLHYVLSERTSDYWQAHRQIESIPERLTELLALWQYQAPSYNDFTEIEEVFPAASYQYVLYGMGFRSQLPVTHNRYTNHQLSQKLVMENQQLIQKYLAGLPTNRELINFVTAQYAAQDAS